MKNIDNIETVDKGKHAKLKVKENPDMAHAKDLNLASVVLNELSACTSNYAVVFIESPQDKVMRPVVLLGLRPGENVYYGEDGWDSNYAPLMIQRHPFVIGYDDRQDDPMVLATCINVKSPWVSEEEGVALFDENGEETEYLLSRHRMINDIFEGEKLNEQFTKMVQDLDLLTPFEMILQPENGEIRKVTGMQTINERKLRELSDEQVLELHKPDFLGACYLILGSMFQLHRLMSLRNKKGDEKIRHYRIQTEEMARQAEQAQAAAANPSASPQA